MRSHAPTRAVGPRLDASQGSAERRILAALVFASGLCALIYQVAWEREFRLVLGASTAASATVLAAFMGGLGLGSVVLGSRVDAHPRPLALYARLELLIALSAASTPPLLELVRIAYVSLGGTAALGPLLGGLLRVALAALVVLPATFLMGGTLPAAARGALGPGDPQRRSVGLLYGCNTLGAVAGALLSTFLMLESFGTRRTLWLATLFNVLVAMAAGRVARGQTSAVETLAAQRQPAAPAGFVYLAAALVGFAFFLMEIVWYRMLGPILGGTVFTFGLVLAVALLGIGLGGAIYARFPGHASLDALATTCLLEALAIGLPFIVGDPIAIIALRLRDHAVPHGLLAMASGWAGVCCLVVLPGAVLAGFQFPLLIGLLGEGRLALGRHMGLAYAWNTAGAMAGAMAGGFGLLPLLSGPGCWRLAALILAGLGVAAALLRSGQARWRLFVFPASAGVVAGFLFATQGPTAVWRHAGIGAGRVATGLARTPNRLRAWQNAQRRQLLWEHDGVESSVALQVVSSVAFVVNGKIDGNAIGDAPTTVMGGLLGALLHGQPQRALVIGLGTGSTAGWLGAVPGMVRVDVIELEPAILEVARVCAPINHDVLANPIVRIRLGDAREALPTLDHRYDIIFSEPSNPYRAGVASLFTREYYQAVLERLNEGGLFIQWVQGYEVDLPTVSNVYATLLSAFPVVETWVARSDMLLVASRGRGPLDAERLASSLRREPYWTALRGAWRASRVEDVLARFVGDTRLAEALAREHGGAPNSDDRNLLEFGFARTLGRTGLFRPGDLLARSIADGSDRPRLVGAAAIDWSLLDEVRTVEVPTTKVPAQALSADARHRVAARLGNLQSQSAWALLEWKAQPLAPRNLQEVAMLAEVSAEEADPSALRYIEELRRLQPVEADAVLARLRYRQGDLAAALTALRSALDAYRRDPWPSGRLMDRTLLLAGELARRDGRLAPGLLALLHEPFSLYGLENERLHAALGIATTQGGSACVGALAPLEPYVPWEPELLILRRACYLETGDPRAGQATRDLELFLAQEATDVPGRSMLSHPGTQASPHDFR